VAVRVVACSDRQQAHSAEAVERLVLGAVVEGEPGLGQTPGDVMRQRIQRITGGQWAAVAVGKRGHRVRQFLGLGKRPQRAQVRWCVIRAARAALDLVQLGV
jgi:hypothetical protein